MIRLNETRMILAAEPRRADAEHLWQCLAPVRDYVCLARSACEALEMVRRQAFSRAVVATELMLDDTPVLARLSRLPALEHLVATGPAGNPEMEILARTSGADLYLTRPVSFERLSRALWARDQVMR